LISLGAMNPHDNWIIAQEVNYLVEAGYDSSAILTAHDCRATPWWCQALRGFAFHAAQRYDDAENAFDSALANMPEPERCSWTDIALLLSDQERDAYTKLPCQQRTEFERRFWLLADPSYIVPGNDRRTEHFSRVLLTKIFATSRNTYGMPWDDDMRELIIRYGMARSYSVTWPDNILGSERLIGHEREPSFHFAAINIGSDSTAWDFHAQDARERYAPPYIDSLVALNAQFAMFKRGDSALVVVAYTGNDVTSTSAVGITGAVNSGSLDVVGTNVRYAHTRWRGIVAGLEQYSASTRRDAQIRQWLMPPTRETNAPQLSTLLFYRADANASDTSTNAADDTTTAALTTALSDIAKRVLPGNDLRGTRKLGVYWEMYDNPSHDEVQNTIDDTLHMPIVADTTVQTDSTDSSAVLMDSMAAPMNSTARIGSDSGTSFERHTLPLRVSISVTRIDGGLGHWLAQTLHLVPRDVPLAVAWRGNTERTGVTTQSVVLDLSQLPSGKYRVSVSAGTDDQHRSVTSSDIRVY
jgi:hypothetical protein